MKRLTSQLCAIILALTVTTVMGPTACFAEQATEAVEVNGVVMTSEQENTVETVTSETENHIDMFSIPEDYRTSDNFGPAFTEGVPQSVVEETFAARGLNIPELIEPTETSNLFSLASLPEIKIESAPINIEDIAIEGSEVSLPDLATDANNMTQEASEPITETINNNSRTVIPVNNIVETNTSEVEEAAPVEQPEVSQPSNRWGITLTQEEKRVLAQIVYKEAGGESDIGEQAVVEVVFNRMASPNWPSSCIGVLSQKGQFSTWKGRNNSKPGEKEYRNIDAVLNGESNILPFKTVYFSRGAQNNRIQTRIGGHVFCNEK